MMQAMWNINAYVRMSIDLTFYRNINGYRR